MTTWLPITRAYVYCPLPKIVTFFTHLAAVPENKHARLHSINQALGSKTPRYVTTLYTASLDRLQYTQKKKRIREQLPRGGHVKNYRLKEKEGPIR